MRRTRWFLAALLAALAVPSAASAHNPSLYSGATWYAKYQAVSSVTPVCSGNVGDGPQLAFGNNVDASHECGSQSETSIAINPADPDNVVAGSNEIQRLPMRAMASLDGGSTFQGVDLPLPPSLVKNGFDFGSDPSVAFDAAGNVYYGYIVVFFGAGGGINGSEMAVARSGNGGLTWDATYFNPQTGEGQFNDKPYVAVDNNPSSPFYGRVYAAWDNASGANGKPSSEKNGNNLLVSFSTDHGASFSTPVVASPFVKGRTGAIAADPFVAPDGTLHVAWLDYVHSLLAESSSTDGGETFGAAHVIAFTQIPFDIDLPAENVRGALVYPTCGASGSSLYCSWFDGSLAGGTDVLFSKSVDGGQHWSAGVPVTTDPPGQVTDQFYPWLAVDPSNGSINISYYDTRNDPSRKATDVFLARSTNGGASFATQQVTNAPTDETCCSPSVNLGNQYGDYEGLAAFGGIVRPVWTDRRQAVIDLGLREEVFTAGLSFGP
jgi:hypothetical protein